MFDTRNILGHHSKVTWPGARRGGHSDIGASPYSMAREADQRGGVLVVRVDERSPSATFRQAAAWKTPSLVQHYGRLKPAIREPRIKRLDTA